MRELDSVFMSPLDSGPVASAVNDLVNVAARAAGAAAWSVRVEQRETAVQEGAIPDQGATVSVDEHAVGIQIASAFTSPADTNMAKAVAPLQLGASVAISTMPSVSNTETLTRRRGR